MATEDGRVDAGAGLRVRCGWARSLTSGNSLLIAGRRQLHGFTSEQGTLWWITNWATDGSERPVFRRINWNSYPIKPLPVGFVPTNRQIDEWRIRWCGFDFYKCHFARANQSSVVRIVPYWSVVVPLTLLSAYLLLAKCDSR